MNFLCIYLGEGKKGEGGGGCANACICMGTHGKHLLQNRLLVTDVYKTW